MKKITIAIDGFSSTGKSTVAKQIAKKLEYIYIDSGAMYRAITLYAMKMNFIDNEEFAKELLIKNLPNIELSFVFNKKMEIAEMYLNGNNVEREIRSLEVSKLVSKVAKVSEVRRMLVKQQQEYGRNKGVVMDGRDIGTVVFPEAELKLFMTASAEKRATRRFDELILRGDKVSFEEILKNVQYRDFVDSTRDDSPLIKADDAIEFDNSNLTLEEQYDEIYKLVNKKIKN